MRMAVVSLALLAGAAVSAPAAAQQTTGVPGSPSATTTVDGNYLLNPPPAFGGEINLNATQSKPYWPPNIVPPKGAPNILLIMTDDQGYGITGTFGGVIPTPAMDRIAQMGLRYTEFQSTTPPHPPWSAELFKCLRYSMASSAMPVIMLLAIERIRWEGETPLTPGKHSLEFDFKYDGPGMGKGGGGVLKVDGKEVASKDIPHTIPAILTLDETLDIGSDPRTPVDDADYQVPFRFTGTIDKMGFKLGPSQMLPADHKSVQEMKDNANK